MPTIRPATPDDDPILIDHTLAMWRDLGVPDAAVVPDAAERIAAFVADARRNLGFAAFVAEDGAAVLGSAGCQLYRAPYPDVLTPDHRLYGYIWGVWVEPEARRRGLATRLVETTLTHLRELGCSRAILNASTPGRPVYAAMGFQSSNEMWFDLSR